MGNAVVLDQVAYKGEVVAGRRGEADLDLLEAEPPAGPTCATSAPRSWARSAPDYRRADQRCTSAARVESAGRASAGSPWALAGKPGSGDDQSGSWGSSCAISLHLKHVPLCSTRRSVHPDDRATRCVMIPGRGSWQPRGTGWCDSCCNDCAGARARGGAGAGDVARRACLVGVAGNRTRVSEQRPGNVCTSDRKYSRVTVVKNCKVRPASR
jgi:hypothetical protein